VHFCTFADLFFILFSLHVSPLSSIKYFSIFTSLSTPKTEDSLPLAKFGQLPRKRAARTDKQRMTFTAFLHAFKCFIIEISLPPQIQNPGTAFV